MSEVRDSAQVAESYKQMYSEFGKDEVCDNKDNKKELRKFLKRHIPRSDQKHIDSELKKTITLAKTKRVQYKQIPQVRKNGKFLKARERRQLGLYKLPKRGMKYQDFLGINELWKGYIRNLVDFNKWKPGTVGKSFHQ